MRNIPSVIIFMAIGVLFTYGSRVIEGRLLGPQDYGLISFGRTLINVVGVTCLVGLPVAMQYFVALHTKAQAHWKLARSLATALTIIVPLTIATSLILYGIRDRLSGDLNADLLLPIIGYFIIAIPFMAIGFLGIDILKGFLKFNQAALLQSVFLPSVIALGAIGLFLTDSLNVATQSVVNLMAYIGYGVTVWWLINKRFNLKRVLNALPAWDKKMLYYALPLGLSVVVTHTVTRFDTLLLGWTVPAYDLGLYAAAVQIAVALPIFLNAARYIFIPISSGKLGDNDSIAKIRQEYLSQTRLVTLLALLPSLIFFTYPAQVIKLLFGADYLGGAFILRVLAVGYFLRSFEGPDAEVLMTLGLTWIHMVGDILGTSLQLCLLYILITNYGINGAPFALLFTYLAIALYRAIFLYRHVHTHPLQLDKIKFTLLGIGINFLLYYATRHLVWENPLWLFPVSLVLLLGFAFSFWTLKWYTKEEYQVLTSVTKKVGL